jgi:hypothetical protein
MWQRLGLLEMSMEGGKRKMNYADMPEVDDFFSGDNYYEAMEREAMSEMGQEEPELKRRKKK